MKNRPKPLFKREKSKRQPQIYKYFLIMDFEATCDQTKDHLDVLPVQEIIEFPVLKVSAESLDVEATFHRFVRPSEHPELSAFCTQLTGIVQDQIDSSDPFPEVLADFHRWLHHEVGPSPALPVTCGDWDLLTALPRQCSLSGVELPQWARQWHNVKQSHSSVQGRYANSLKKVLEDLKLTPEGVPHRGIDDCRNIANIVRALAERGVVFGPTKALRPEQVAAASR